MISRKTSNSTQPMHGHAGSFVRMPTFHASASEALYHLPYVSFSFTSMLYTYTVPHEDMCSYRFARASAARAGDFDVPCTTSKNNDKRETISYMPRSGVNQRPA